MAKGSQKGYVTLQFRDPRTGQVYHQSVKVGSSVHKNWLRQKRQHEKIQRAARQAAKRPPMYGDGLDRIIL
jgi:hypothetical protein